MGNPVLTKNYTAEAEVLKHRIVKFGSEDGGVVYAAAATDGSIGVSNELDAATGERADIIRTGMPDVEYGGTIARGDLLTSDSVGRAIAATASAGSNVRIVGVAEVSGVVDDIGTMTLGCSMMQG